MFVWFDDASLVTFLLFARIDVREFEIVIRSYFLHSIGYQWQVLDVQTRFECYLEVICFRVPKINKIKMKKTAKTYFNNNIGWLMTNLSRILKLIYILST